MCMSLGETNVYVNDLKNVDHPVKEKFDNIETTLHSAVEDEIRNYIKGARTQNGEFVMFTSIWVLWINNCIEDTRLQLAPNILETL